MWQKRSCLSIICVGFFCLVAFAVIYPGYRNAKTEIVQEVMATKGMMIVNSLIEHKNTNKCLKVCLLIDKNGRRLSFQNSTQFFSVLAKMSRDKPSSEKFDNSWVTLNEVSPDMKTKDGCVAEKYVMWSIAGNLPNCIPTNLPILLTRNIDVSSLACEVSKEDMKKKIKLDRRYTTGYENEFACVVYADGYVKTYNLKKRREITYYSIYRGMILNCGHDNVRYLTPTEEVALEREAE